MMGDQLECAETRGMEDKTVAGRNSSSSASSSGSETICEDHQPEPPAVSLAYLLVVTCPNFGIQVLWLILMSYGTPFMVGLGIPTSITALIWLAGPLSGTFAQPLFAVLSDRTRHAWGKRKPFIALGASCACLSLLGMACAEDVADLLMSTDYRQEMYGKTKGRPGASLLAQILAIVWACALCLAIQPLQCGVRALIVDSAPSHQQCTAAAWSARFNGLGAVMISGSSFLDLARVAPYLGNTTFKGLCVLGAIAVCCTTIPVCLIAEDRPATPVRKRSSLRSLIAQAWRTSRNLPPVTREVCKIQFFAWLGWFSTLYYSTTYVYEIFALENHVHLDPKIWGWADIRLSEVGEEAGHRAAFAIAVVTFGVSMLLPLLARNSSDSGNYSAGFSPVMHVCGISIGRLWQLGHLLFAALMFLTLFVSTVAAATTIVATLAVSWCITTWVPFALINAEAASLRSAREGEKSNSLLRHEEISASIMSIHNMAISIPQILAALGCTVLFEIIELTGRHDPVSFAFKFAGIMAAVAAYLGRNLE